jgi:hypothetical protein
MVPMVFLIRIFFSPSWEIEPEPSIDFVWVGDGFRPVIVINFLCFTFLLVISSGFVVED